MMASGGVYPLDTQQLPGESPQTLLFLSSRSPIDLDHKPPRGSIFATVLSMRSGPIWWRVFPSMLDSPGFPLLETFQLDLQFASLAHHGFDLAC